MQSRYKLGLFILILLVGAYFRFTGLNWDANQHLHPDERFLTMAAGALSWPRTLGEYFATAASPLNPHNRGYNFFVYGTFPLFFVKATAEALGRGDYNQLTIVGRALSGLMDLGTLILVFLITQTITRYRANSALLACFFYATMGLPIQLSHFFAVDPYLTFFLTLSFYLLLKIVKLVPSVSKDFKLNKNCKTKVTNFVLLGISFGLALAAKISALLFLPIVLLGFFFILRSHKTNFTRIVIFGLLFCLFSYLTVRVFYPYLFTDGKIFSGLNSKILANWKQLKNFDGVNTNFPPALQWIPTKPLIYPLVQNLLWGLGIPLGIVSFFSFLFIIYHLSFIIVRKKMTKQINLVGLVLTLFWIGLLFFYQSLQFSKNLRYFYPIYPFLAIISGITVANFLSRFKSPRLHSVFYWSDWSARGRIGLLREALAKWGVIGLLVFICLWWSFAFTSIYRSPHTRVRATNWIYRNLPRGSILANETWDDPLPFSSVFGQPEDYQGLNLPLYDPDSAEKWQSLSKRLTQTDYLLLTSNRLWRSLSAIPDRYPLTSRYYKLLFSGDLGFQQIAAFTSYPCLLPRLSHLSNLGFIKTNLTPPSISLTSTTSCLLALGDDGAEESFTVYDHPKVLIFQNSHRLSAQELFKLITFEATE